MGVIRDLGYFKKEPQNLAFISPDEVIELTEEPIEDFDKPFKGDPDITVAIEFDPRDGGIDGIYPLALGTQKIDEKALEEGIMAYAPRIGLSLPHWGLVYSHANSKGMLKLYDRIHEIDTWMVPFRIGRRDILRVANITGHLFFGQKLEHSLFRREDNLHIPELFEGLGIISSMKLDYALGLEIGEGLICHTLYNEVNEKYISFYDLEAIYRRLLELQQNPNLRQSREQTNDEENDNDFITWADLEF